jgi:hypothetical protein
MSAQRQVPPRRDTAQAQFRDILLRALGEHPPAASEVGLAPDVYRMVLTGRTVRGWDTYERMLEVVAADWTTREAVHSAWRATQPAAATRSGAGRRRTPSADSGSPAVASVTIAATNAQEFNAMLREFLARSGMRPNQVATRTKIPRSQIYALFDPGRVSLPTKRDQLIAILRIFRASEDQIKRVLAVWQGLYLSRPTPSQNEERITEWMTSAVDAVRREFDAGQAEHHVLDPDLIPIMILAVTGVAMLAVANIGEESSTPFMRTATAVGGILVGLGIPAAFPLLNRTCGPRLRRHWSRMVRSFTTT